MKKIENGAAGNDVRRGIQKAVNIVVDINNSFAKNLHQAKIQNGDGFYKQ